MLTVERAEGEKCYLKLDGDQSKKKEKNSKSTLQKEKISQDREFLGR